jgi:hypothetical protein
MVRDVNRESLTDLYMLVLSTGMLAVREIRSNPLTSIGNAYCYLGKASQIVMMCINAYRLVRFQGSRFES